MIPGGNGRLEEERVKWEEPTELGNSLLPYCVCMHRAGAVWTLKGRENFWMTPQGSVFCLLVYLCICV